MTSDTPDLKKKETPTVSSRGRISVGECLDQLLNRECRFPFERGDGLNEEEPKVFGGLVCPSRDGSRPGTGNIVIKGAAGSGKSTLGLQIAVEAARRNTNVNTAYISLEETPQQLLSKARMFGWQNWLTPLTLRADVHGGQPPLRDELSDDLFNVLSQPSFLCPNTSAKDSVNHKAGNCINSSDNACEFGHFPSRCEKKCRLNKVARRSPVCGGFCHLSFDNHVLLPNLEARVFEPSDDFEKHDSLFRIRMLQLEDLLHAACQLNDIADIKPPQGEKKYKGKRLDIVCIDSLNVLGQGHLTRDHLSALFDLFRRYRVIGVFIYEHVEQGHLAGQYDHGLKDIEFLADTVIDLTGREYQGYWVRHLHVSKSRHQQQVLGRHPFKILEEGSKERGKENKGKMCPYLVTTQSYKVPADGEITKEVRMSRFGIRVYPSIHTVIRSCKPRKTGQTENSPKKVFFQDKNLNNIGGEKLQKSAPVVATVFGPPVAGKSVLAFNFLLQGLIEGKNGILITLGETCTFNSGNAVIGEESANKFQDEGAEDRGRRENLLRSSEFVNLLESCERLEGVEENVCRILRYVAEHHKVTFAVWRHEDCCNGVPSIPNYVIEMALKPGTLLPEEVVAFVRQIYGALTLTDPIQGRDRWPARAVLQDASKIGFAYPFLRETTTGPELFLSGLAHLFHCRETDFLITAPTGGIAASVDIAKLAVSLADSALECAHLDVFGDRYVTITGPGMIERDVNNVNTPEGVPGVLRRNGHTFSVDMDALSDLVGFSTGDIRRPGVLLQLFEEGGLHQKYNHQVKRLVQFAMGVSTRDDNPADGGETRVQVDTFDSSEASAFHHSLDLLSGAPLNKTVIRTVDEFAFRTHMDGAACEGGEVHKKRRISSSERYGSLYYRNMLLFLCDKDTYATLEPLQRKLENVRLMLQLVVGFEALAALRKVSKKCGEHQDILQGLVTLARDHKGKMAGLLIKTDKNLVDRLASCNDFAETHDRQEQIFQQVRETINDVACKIHEELSIHNKKEKGNTNPTMDCIRNISEVKSLESILRNILSESEQISAGSSGQAGELVKELLNLTLPLFHAVLFVETGKCSAGLKRKYKDATLAFWNEFKQLTVDDSNPATFLYDKRARETFASLALDGILSLVGHHKGELDLADADTNDNVVKTLQAGGGDAPLNKWVGYLAEILPHAQPLLESPRDGFESGIDSQRPFRQKNRTCAILERTSDEKCGLTDEASLVFKGNKKFILLAWYSHIRELIDLVAQARELDRSACEKNKRHVFKDSWTPIRNMRVLSLPAGGVKGDWFLQAPAGSVSESLGKKIRDRLLDTVEDFNRFAAGVGLPSWPRRDSVFEVDSSNNAGQGNWLAPSLVESAKKRFGQLQRYSNEKIPQLIKAWPGGEVSLQDLLELHRFAHRRSDISGYEKIRDELFAIMEDLRLQNKRRPDGEGVTSDEHAKLIISLLMRLKGETQKKSGK